jgi:hypothetical protein
MKMWISRVAMVSIMLVGGLGFYLFRASPYEPTPADSRCLSTEPDHGMFVPTLLNPPHIYGLGLTYATHIRETSWNLDRIAGKPDGGRHSIPTSGNAKLRHQEARRRWQDLILRPME